MSDALNALRRLEAGIKDLARGTSLALTTALDNRADESTAWILDRLAADAAVLSDEFNAAWHQDANRAWTP